MDPNHLMRLQQEQEKALFETDAKLEQLQKFKEGYQVLQQRLKTLPDKITHDVMVPFGKFAFMPGQIVHTNEILVLLGDNWFVERSSKQAAEIAGRRIQELDKNMKDLRGQRKLLEPRLGFTSDLQDELQKRGGVQEIVEEYDEEKEKLWDEQHRKNVQRQKEEQRKNTASSQPESKKEKIKEQSDEDSALWSRLDELERLEAERGEMDSHSDDDDEEDNSNNNSARNAVEDADKRRVQWVDDEVNKKEDEESDDDDEEDDEEEEEEEEDEEEEGNVTEDNGRPLRKIITFKHTPTPAILPHQVCASGDSGIQSPADIYKLYRPKSILKNKSTDKDHPFDDTYLVSPSSSSAGVDEIGDRITGARFHPREEPSLLPGSIDEIKSSRQAAQKAFSGVIVEKPILPHPPSASVHMPPSSSAASATAAAAENTEPPKRVSKFKASRMKQSQS